MKWDDNRVLSHGLVIITVPVPKWDSCFTGIVLPATPPDAGFKSLTWTSSVR
jgi:hypothetical protein